MYNGKHGEVFEVSLLVFWPYAAEVLMWNCVERFGVHYWEDGPWLLGTAMSLGALYGIGTSTSIF